VVSMPSFRIFEEQPDPYKQQIFPDHLPKLAVEAGAPMSWYKYVGRHGDVIGLERFGASSLGTVALQELGYSVDNITKRAKQLLERVRPAATAGKA
jgi:transketolase